MTVEPPRPEYPRPQFRRPDWTNLNGEWRFAFDDDDAGLAQGWHSVSAENLRSDRPPFDRSITVPFCYQAKLSGIGDTSFHDVVWYARTFDRSPGEHLLHFGAVDYRASVWVNGTQVASHEGGHTPFCADVTPVLAEGENVIVVRAEGLPLVGYTWWPFFSLVDWDYREGVKPAKDYLRHMGMYDLEPNGKEGFLRVKTPIVRAFREAAVRRIKTLQKERVPKEDGRYIIFYSFEDEDEKEEVEDSGEDSTS